MKKRKYYIFPLCVLLLTGCGEKELPEMFTSEIRLGVGGLGETSSRSAVDAWDETPVSLAYVYAPATQFTQSLTVTVSTNAGEQINTGLEYPMGGTAVSFVGYHPVATPNVIGEVSYDISKGNVDVMMSNTVSGTQSSPITTHLDFKHKLTRVRFIMQCLPGTSYPEPVFGVLVNANGTKALCTAATLDLNAGDISFKIPGSLFVGSMDGYSIPLTGMDPLVIDVMFQPGVPVDFKLASLTEVKDINIDTDPNGYWAALKTTGGQEGVQYMVKLSFSGVAILGQSITAGTWETGTTITNPTWW